MNIPTTSRKTGGGGFAPSSKEERAKAPAQPGAKAPSPAQPEAKAPAQPGAKAPAPAQPGTEAPAPAKPGAKKPGAGLNIPTTSRKTGGGGFAPSSKEERANTVKEVAAALPEIAKSGSLEDFKAGLSSLFDGTGYETGGSDNPLEDQGPDPYAKWRGTPAEPRTDATAGTGDPNQTEIFRANTNYKKPTPRPSLIRQKPKPEAPARAAGSSDSERLKQLMDSGMSSAQAGAQLRSEIGLPKASRNAAQRKAAKKGTTSSAEYQEFAQSIRSLMR